MCLDLILTYHQPQPQFVPLLGPITRDAAGDVAERGGPSCGARLSLLSSPAWAERSQSAAAGLPLAVCWLIGGGRLGQRFGRLNGRGRAVVPSFWQPRAPRGPACPRVDCGFGDGRGFGHCAAVCRGTLLHRLRAAQINAPKLPRRAVARVISEGCGADDLVRTLLQHGGPCGARGEEPCYWFSRSWRGCGRAYGRARRRWRHVGPKQAFRPVWGGYWCPRARYEALRHCKTRPFGATRPEAAVPTRPNLLYISVVRVHFRICKVCAICCSGGFDKRVATH